MTAAILSTLIGIAFLGAMGEVIRFLAKRHAEGLRRELPTSYDPWFAIRPQLGGDTPGGCLHLKPEPVILIGETEPVNWVCSDCLVKLENGDQAVVARKATDLKKKLREDADREFSQMFMPPSLAEHVEEARRIAKAEMAIKMGERGLLSRGAVSNIVNRADYEPTFEIIRDGAGNIVRRVERPE